MLKLRVKYKIILMVLLMLRSNKLQAIKIVSHIG